MLIDLVGAVQRQHEPVAVPVGKEIGRGRNEEGNQGAAPSPEQVADPHEQGRQRSKQDSGPHVVHRDLLAVKSAAITKPVN